MTYGNFKVHQLLCKRAHLVVEAEAVISNIACSEHEVTLALPCAIKNNLISRTGNYVIDVK